ncbi:phage tail tube protein [Lysobacter korlensis]|uniref:Phage tail tube protein n=1 Tax=Lysobacter korlensis TaxID=553636 RepID=A0ABV6RKK5_9GAMM
MSVIKSQGTHLHWATAATTNNKVTCATGISGLGGAADQVDITCLDDSERKFVKGLGNPGQVTVPFNLHADDASHSALMALKESGAVVSWGIYGSQATTAPTTVGSVMQPVVGRTSAIFNGYISDINIDVAGNDIWKGTITIQRSGAVAWDLTLT